MRETAKSFQDLVVWQKAHQAVLEPISKLVFCTL